MIASRTICEITIFGSPTTASSNDQTWENEMANELALIPPEFSYGKFLSVDAKFYIKKNRLNGRKLDLDNLVSIVFNSLVSSLVIQDDSYIRQCSISKVPTNSEECLELTLKELI